MMPQSYTGTHVAFGGNGGQSSFGIGGFGGNTGGNIVTAGQTVTITDASGNTVYTAQSQAPRNASYVVFAGPALASGGSYKLNGGTAATATSSSGGMGPGGPGGPGNPGGRNGNEADASVFARIMAWIRSLFERVGAFFRSLSGK